MTPFHMDILAADRIFYDGDCESLVVPTTNGQYGIQAGHCNMVSAIVTGTLMYRLPGEEMQEAAVSNGLVKVEDGGVLVLVNSIERPDEIDANRAQREADAAREELLQKKSIQEYRTIQGQMARALNRLKVKRNYDKGGGFGGF